MKRTMLGILLHVIFWIGIWFFFFYFFNYNSPDRGYVLWFSSLLLPLTMVVTYFLVYFLFPRYLYTKKYWQLALYGFYTLLASSYFIVILIYGCMFLYGNFNAANLPPMVKNFFFILILVYLVVGVVSFVTILNRNFITEKRNKELQNKMLSAQLQLKEQELHYLKKQIHPHFLFNTLNTIYGLSIKRSARTPEVILKLSNLLDYILYQVDRPGVSLKEEVLHIREYVELEKIRFQDSLKVDFESDDIDEGIRVPPMLLIPLVENAFKHGEQVDGFLRIGIRIELKGPGLKFHIRNSLREAVSDDGNGGLGLENFRKRLDLNYLDHYTLENDVSDGWYVATLTIPDIRSFDHG
jgi:sensor histidine kinase YesM